MATHSSILAWRIPWTEDPGRLQSMGSQRFGNHGIWIANPSQCSEKLDYVQNQKAESQGPEAAEIKTFDEICCPLSHFFFKAHARESTGVYTCTELRTSTV